MSYSITGDHKYYYISVESNYRMTNLKFELIKNTLDIKTIDTDYLLMTIPLPEDTLYCSPKITKIEISEEQIKLVIKKNL